MIPRTRSRLRWSQLLTAAAATLRTPAAGGPRVADFEKRFADGFGFAHAVALSSVRFGLHWTLRALALPPGSEVLCTPISLAPVLDAVRAAGLVPVFVDVTRDGFSPDLAAAEARCTAKTRALVVTHLWGLPANGPAIAAFCRARELALVEDASQCLGARVDGRPAGGFGRAGLFSFSPTKTINCFHGAMLVSDDADLVARLRRERDALPAPGRGRIARYVAAEALLKAAFDPPLGRVAGGLAVGAAHRLGLDDFRRADRLPAAAATSGSLAALACGFGVLQAEAGLATLAAHPAGLARRRAIVRAYRAALAPLGLGFGGLVPGAEPGDWVTVAFHPEVRELRRRLWQTARVDTTRPSLDLCSALFDQADATPIASELLANAFYLPNHPELDDRDVDEVVRAVSAVIESLA
jgi:dTDP-4-amino-4,6-dideoxygalactose transaminase